MIKHLAPGLPCRKAARSKGQNDGTFSPCREFVFPHGITQGDTFLKHAPSMIFKKNISLRRTFPNKEREHFMQNDKAEIPALTLDDLRKSYLLPRPLLRKKAGTGPGVKRALAGVSLTLGPGLYGLLGPNGAGKSTLIQIITGGLAPDSGEVLWCGHPARGTGFRRILGYMPQQQGLYDSYTGRRFLAYMAALKEIPRKSVSEEVARVSQAVNLAGELDKRLGAYSGGMKQRLLLASALLGNPRLLILDEPTAGLDPRERVRLRTLLAEMSADRIILVATHVVSDVESVASKVVLLRAGQIVDVAPVPELVERYAPGGGLEDVYLSVFGEGDGR